MITRHEARMFLLQDARLSHGELLPEVSKPSPMLYAFQETWRPPFMVVGPWVDYYVPYLRKLAIAVIASEIFVWILLHLNFLN